MTQPKSHGSKTDRLKGHGLSVWTALGFHLIDDISREISSYRIALFPKFCYLISKLFFQATEKKRQINVSGSFTQRQICFAKSGLLMGN